MLNVFRHRSLPRSVGQYRVGSADRPRPSSTVAGPRSSWPSSSTALGTTHLPRTGGRDLARDTALAALGWVVLRSPTPTCCAIPSGVRAKMSSTVYRTRLAPAPRRLTACRQRKPYTFGTANAGKASICRSGGQGPWRRGRRRRRCAGAARCGRRRRGSRPCGWRPPPPPPRPPRPARRRQRHRALRGTADHERDLALHALGGPRRRARPAAPGGSPRRSWSAPRQTAAVAVLPERGGRVDQRVGQPVRRLEEDHRPRARRPARPGATRRSPALRGRKPSKQNRSTGSPDTASAVVTADGPGHRGDRDAGLDRRPHERVAGVGHRRHAGVGEQQHRGAVGAARRAARAAAPAPPTRGR